MTEAAVCDARGVLVLVTGVPGSGKTTLGRRLAQALEASFLSLDEIKERLYDAGHHRADSERLRYAAEEELAETLMADEHTVVVDVWVAPARDEERVRNLLRRQARPVVQVLCRVPAAVAVERYEQRPRSGPHLPPDQPTLDRIGRAAAQITPLGVGACIEVDTSHEVDLDALLARLAQAAPPGHRLRPHHVG